MKESTQVPASNDAEAQSSGRHPQTFMVNVKRLITASAAVAMGVALFMGAGSIDAPTASAKPPECQFLGTCPTPPPDPTPIPTATPACQTRFCNVAIDPGTVLEVEPADPTLPPCPARGPCVDPENPGGGTLDPGEGEASEPTATPEPSATTPPTTEPTDTPQTQVDPTATTPPAQGTSGGQAGTGSQSGTTAPQDTSPATQQSGQSTPETQANSAASAVSTQETKASLDAKSSDSSGGLGILSVALVAIGIAIPASAGAYVLARRQKE